MLDQRWRTALVGFDDLMLADMLEPAVTVVAQDPATMGAQACQILFSRMDGDQSEPATVTVPTRLIPRSKQTRFWLR